MSTTLNIILGAGFSFHAGLPLVNDITQRFQRTNKAHIIRQSSDEWQWDDLNSPALVNNGRLGFDHIAGGYLLDELVKDYIKSSRNFKNYEVFFQYLLDNGMSSRCWLHHIFGKAKSKMSIDKPNLSEFYKEFLKYPELFKLVNLVSELIGDSLKPTKEDDEIIRVYEHFIEAIKKYKIVNIYSLNHDLLTEGLLGVYKIPFSDGFTSYNSEIFYNESPQRMFQNFFLQEGVRVFKVHGSLDIIDFVVMKQNGSFLERTGAHLYFKADNYYAKHTAVRVDLSSGQTVQDFQPNISPFFVTGSNKLSLIESNYMFSSLYKHMKSGLESNSDLLIIGYSYGDDHINNLLAENVNCYKPFVVNVNPREEFPIPGYSNVLNLLDIAEL